jgi:hypothetical protein
VIKDRVSAQKNLVALKYRREKPSYQQLRMNDLLKVFRARGLTEPQIDAQLAFLGPKVWGTTDELGNAIQLSFEEKVTLVTKTIRAFDASPAEVSAYHREQRRPMRNLRRRVKRQIEKARRAQIPVTNHREQAVFCCLRNDWRSAPEIAREVARANAFRDKDDRPIAAGSLRKAMHRILDAALARGMIEERFKKGARGLLTRWVRSVDPGANSRISARDDVTVERLSPLHVNGPTSERELKEPVQINGSHSDKILGQHPTPTVTEERVNISLVSEPTEFPELPACLDQRPKGRRHGVRRTDDAFSVGGL